MCKRAKRSALSHKAARNRQDSKKDTHKTQKDPQKMHRLETVSKEITGGGGGGFNMFDGTNYTPISEWINVCTKYMFGSHEKSLINRGISLSTYKPRYKTEIKQR